MNLWRIAIDESTGTTHGDLEPLTSPSPYVAYFSLAANGAVAAYTSLDEISNIASVSFEPRTATASGSMEDVTTGTHSFAYIDVSPDGRSLVAGTSPRDQEDLFIVDTGTRAIRQLTNDFARDRMPRWAADGKRIFMYSDRGGPTNVWSVGGDGSELRQMSDLPFLGYPSVASDGRRVAAADQTTQRIFIYDAKDWSRPIEALPNPPQVAGGFPIVFDWSADGKLLLGGSGAPLVGAPWLYDTERRAYRRFPSSGGRAVLIDDHRFVFTQNQGLAVGDFSTNTSRELLRLPREILFDPRFNADRSKLFFIRRTVSGDVWIVRFKPEQ